MTEAGLQLAASLAAPEQTGVQVRYIGGYNATLVEAAGLDYAATEAGPQLALLCDILGNPFRPVAVDPAWRTTDVLLLAHGIYHDGAFDRMPILADAIQDAGCDHADLLAHLRGDGPHVRGCWALDLILGKE